jgi:hypothetical protein
VTETEKTLRAIASFCGLIALLICLHLLGQGTYALPEPSPQGIQDWLRSTNTTVITLALVRAAVFLATLYVVVTTVLSVVAHGIAGNRLTAMTNHITLPATRTLAIRLAGITAIGSLAVPATSAHATGGPADVPVLRHLTPDQPDPTFTTTTTTGAPRTTTTSSPTKTAPAERPSAAVNAGTVTTPESKRHHSVQPSENFWIIARQRLTLSLQREPTEGELVDYWRVLVKTNRHLLADRTNPDLLFTGQVIELP